MPLLWISLAYLTGDISALLLHTQSLFWLAGSVAAAVGYAVSYLARKYPRLAKLSWTIPFRLPLNPLPYPLLILAFMLGGLRYTSAQPQLVPGFTGYHAQTGATMIVEGLVSRPPVQRDRYLSVEVTPQRLVLEDGTLIEPVEGNLLATLTAGRRIDYGDRVLLDGKLEVPFETEDFSYRGYLAGRGIYAVMAFPKLDVLAYNQGSPIMDWIYRLRMSSVETLYRLYPDPEASLLAGILLGVESGIPDDVEDAFRTTGTSHIIVISGFNVSIIAGLLMYLFEHLFRRWWGTVLTILGITFYTVLVGGESPVVRAAIMGSLAVVGMQIGRSGNGFNALAIAAAFMVFFDPDLPAEVSFQLSFMATLGMMLYSTPWTERFKAWIQKRIPSGAALPLSRFISDGIIVTLAAQVFTLPLILHYFGRMSIISFIANPLILPIQPQVMALGGLSTILGIFYLPIGKIIALLAWPFTAYTIRMTEALAQQPWAEVPTGPIAPGWLVAFIGVVLFCTFQPERFKALLKRISPLLPGVCIAAAAIFVWGLVFSTPDGKLHITLLDVDSGGIEGQSFLIQTPAGRRLLIGGGPSARQLSSELGRRLAYQNGIDWLVIPVTGKGRLDGLVDIVDRYPPEHVLWAGEMRETSTERRLYDALEDADVAVIPMETGQSLDLGSGARLEVLSVGIEGADLLVMWNNFSLLVPADENIPIVRSGVSAVVLAGDDPIESVELLELSPWVVMISGLPQDLRSFEGYNLLSTIQNGWIELSTDGDELWVEVERK